VHDTIERWARVGRFIDVFGRRIFVWESGSGKPLLALHGFPSSSRDWWELAQRMPDRRFIAFDCPGFGLSDKSARAEYSIVAYADVAQEIARQLRVEECDVLAHDMGDSVAAELLARAGEGKLTFKIESCVLLNGSIFIDMARLTSGQKLLLRMKPRKRRIPFPVRPFRLQLRRMFANDPPKGVFVMMERLLARDGGARLLPVTIRYIEERRRRQERWTRALVEFPGALTAIWGEVDPVAVPAMVDRLVGLRPNVTVVRWPDVGHWPSIEAPDRLADKLGRLLT
jgi:pimeloyl-ACP methyl ester carboxylesterase